MRTNTPTNIDLPSSHAYRYTPSSSDYERVSQIFTPSLGDWALERCAIKHRGRSFLPSWYVFACLGKPLVRDSLSCAYSHLISSPTTLTRMVPRIVLHGTRANASIFSCALDTVASALKQSKHPTQFTSSASNRFSHRLSSEDEYNKEKKQDAIILRAVPFSPCECESLQVKRDVDS